MYCEFCGKEIKKDIQERATFCPYCGKKRLVFSSDSINGAEVNNYKKNSGVDERITITTGKTDDGSVYPIIEGTRGIFELKYNALQLQKELVLSLFTEGLQRKIGDKSWKYELYKFFADKAADEDSDQQYKDAFNVINNQGIDAYLTENIDTSFLVNLILYSELKYIVTEIESTYSGEIKTDITEILKKVLNDRNKLEHLKGTETIDELRQILFDAFLNIECLRSESDIGFLDRFLNVADGFDGNRWFDSVEIDSPGLYEDLIQEEGENVFLAKGEIFRAWVDAAYFVLRYGNVVVERNSPIDEVKFIQNSIFQQLFQAIVRNNKNWKFDLFVKIQNGFDGEFHKSFSGARSIIKRIGMDNFGIENMDVTLLNSVFLYCDYLDDDATLLRGFIADINTDRKKMSHMGALNSTEEIKNNAYNAIKSLRGFLNESYKYLEKKSLLTRDEREQYRNYFEEKINNVELVIDSFTGYLLYKKNIEESIYWNGVTNVGYLAWKKYGHDRWLVLEQAKERFNALKSDPRAYELGKLTKKIIEDTKAAAQQTEAKEKLNQRKNEYRENRKTAFNIIKAIIFVLVPVALFFMGTYLISEVGQEQLSAILMVLFMGIAVFFVIMAHKNMKNANTDILSMLYKSSKILGILFLVLCLGLFLVWGLSKIIM